MLMLPPLRSLLLSKQKVTVKNGLAMCQPIFCFLGPWKQPPVPM